MDWDDMVPKPKPQMMVGEPLATLSIGELEQRIKALEAEIARVRAAVEKKQAHEAAAAALFKR